MADRTASSITVGVPRPAIIDVIADFAAYPDWAAGVRSATVEKSDAGGRPLRVRFVLDAGVLRDSYVLAYEWDDATAVRWDLAEPGATVIQLSGAYLLADAAGGTHVSYELEVGTRLPMPGLLKRRAEKTIIDSALRGLKSRAESVARAG